MKKECAKTSFQRQVFSFLQRNISSRTKTIWIGFSAGLDSSVLIYLLSLYLQQQDKNSTISLKAIHINHGLQDGSTLWENQCQLVCDTLNIPLIVKRFSHIVSHGKGLEQAARAARFSAFDHYLEENDVLCLAHHLQDQAETFLYRLIRGSGIHGLAAMQAVQRRQSYYILKPLLDSPHEQLKLFAREHNIQWLDDPSNQQQKFDRNFLRQTILAGLRKRWSDIDLRIYKTTALCREQASLLNELAILDSNNLHCANNSLDLFELKKLSPARIRNFIGWWLREEGLQLPSRARLKEIQTSLSFLKMDSRFQQKVADFVLVQSGKTLSLIPAEMLKSFNCADYVLEKSVIDDYCQIILNFKKFKIIVKIKFSVKQKKLKNIVNVKFGLRQKTLLLRQHDHHKKVKNIFQENKIPTWLRSNWPLIFVNDELIAICGVAVVKQQTATSEDLDFSSKCIFSWGLNGHLERTDKIF